MTELKQSARNLEEVKEMNLSSVIKLLQKKDICSRADLAKASGLRQSTITNIVNHLIDCGFVEETGFLEGKKGRRSIGIRLKNQSVKVIGIRLTRRSFMIGKYDIGGNEDCFSQSVISKDDSVEKVLGNIETVIRNFIAEDTQQIFAIGIALPGPLLMNEERIVMMTGVSGWEKVNFRKYFEERFSIPVYIEHDANAGALAEWWFGKNKMESGTNMYVAAGQGIGAGIAVDGKILHGALGIAGEIGHMSINFDGPRCQCGNRGCLENYCSVLAMKDYVDKGISSGRETILKKNCDIRQIADAMDCGDELATEVFKKTAWFLGFGLASLVNVYNPNTIIIGDELIGMGQPLLALLKETMKAHVLPEIYNKMNIRFTSFERDPALVGAAALAIEELLRKPTTIIPT